LEKEIDIDGQHLHYEVTGNGKPLILMHGWGCSHTTVSVIAAAASITHTVYNLDMPGFGLSPEPASVWGVAEYCRMVENFIKALNLSKPVLVGHSFGGRVAIMLAAHQNIEIDSLVLVDAAGVKPHRNLRYYFKVYSFKAAKTLMRLALSNEKYTSRIERMRARRGSSDYANASPAMRAIMSKVVNEDLTPLLSSVSKPTLLIWGENDTATPISDAKKMEQLIPDAGLVSFPGCGHYSFLENPIQFKAVLNSFLSTRP